MKEIQRHKVNVLGMIEIAGGLSASITTLVFGYLLDKKKCYKMLYLLVTLASMLCYATYYISLNMHIIWVTFIFGVFIVFLIEIYVALEILAGVINYPVHESVTASLVTIAEQTGGTTFTFIITAIVNNISILAAFIFIVSTLFINCLLIFTVKTLMHIFNPCEDEQSGLQNVLVYINNLLVIIHDVI
ncbi:feline leukemia virus subgroup C receptor-related protein 2-like protein [Leptotrombidium deliense]|uniref:Feline leukemia virus subgroup C receptor-related protein 2-like protein n=1 Tax=Leptotrombidium deliense TaxID=299467 RepID=A0A443RZE5_9ACAR|nr:feline leukemia virus subgroup C receptor-related protein 2-like protein [Leptotrombidium deliense]